MKPNLEARLQKAEALATRKQWKGMVLAVAEAMDKTNPYRDHLLDVAEQGPDRESSEWPTQDLIREAHRIAQTRELPTLAGVPEVNDLSTVYWLIDATGDEVYAWIVAAYPRSVNSARMTPEERREFFRKHHCNCYHDTCVKAANCKQGIDWTPK